MLLYINEATFADDLWDLAQTELGAKRVSISNRWAVSKKWNELYDEHMDYLKESEG